MKTYERRRPFHRRQEKGLRSVDVCRLCLSSSNERRNIFEASDEVPLPMKIMACVSIQVWEGDGLPSGICFKCTAQLNVFFKFRERCREADSKLHEVSRKLDVHTMKPDSEDERKNKGNVAPSSEEPRSASPPSGPLPSEYIEGSIDAVIVVSSCNSPLPDTSVIPVGQNDNSERNIYVMEKLKYNPEKIVNSNKSVGQSKTGEIKNNVYELDNFCAQSDSDGKTDNDNNDDSHSSVLCRAENVDDSLSKVITNSSVFKCNKCRKGFSKRIDLKRHSSVHDEQRGFVCSVCEKWFPDKTNFKRHERVHTGERPFCCTFCQKCFSQESILSRHIMIHKGEKPYKCEVCSRSFIQKQALEVHMRRHLNQEVQQFPCPLCNKAFCHQSGLSRHLLAHTGKTFNCLICSKSFSDQSSLKRHSKTHILSTKKTEVMFQ